MRGASAAETVVSPLRRRMRFGAFFSRMWLLLTCRRRSLPVPVTLKRLAAPRWVFILGMWSLSALCGGALGLGGVGHGDVGLDGGWLGGGGLGDRGGLGGGRLGSR